MCGRCVVCVEMSVWCVGVFVGEVCVHVVPRQWSTTNPAWSYEDSDGGLWRMGEIPQLENEV